MSQCSFTAQDKKETTDGLSFQAPNGSRKLLISFPSGEIHYEIKPPRYGPTNLAQGVPLMAEVPKLAEDFLGKMGISMLEITNPFVDGLNMQGTPKFLFCRQSADHQHRISDGELLEIGGSHPCVRWRRRSGLIRRASKNSRVLDNLANTAM
jgi:hypothetical protein